MIVLRNEPDSEIDKFTPQYRYQWLGKSICIRLLRGDQMQDGQSLFREISGVLQFDVNWGWNWNALDDLLCDLEECKPFESIVFHFTNFESILIKEKKNRSLFVEILNEASDYWWQAVSRGGLIDKPIVPFFVITNQDLEDFAALSAIESRKILNIDYLSFRLAVKERKVDPSNYESICRFS